MSEKPRVTNAYCTDCRWLPRAGWTAQELLTTVEDEIGEVALIPGSGGVFDVVADGTTVLPRAEEDRFRRPTCEACRPSESEPH